MAHWFKDDFAQRRQAMLPWLFCFLASLFFFYEFVQMNMFNALSVSLLKSFNINAAQLGNLSACYFYAMLLALIPVGLLLDYFPTKRLILIAMLVSISGTLWFSLSSSLHMAQAARFLSGLGGAFAFQSALRVAVDNFPPARLALVNGLIITFAMCGGIVAQLPLTWLTELVNWRHVLWIYAGLGGLFFCAIALGLPNTTKKLVLRMKNNSTIKYSSDTNIIIEKIKLALCNRQTWLGGLYTCAFNLPIPLLGAIWGSLYLTQAHHLSREEASRVISLLFVGMIIGAPLFGWLYGKVMRSWLPMVLGAALTLIVILTIIYLPNLSKTTLSLLFLALGLFSGVQTIGYAIVAAGNPLSRSTAIGIASLLIMGGGAVAQPLFGWLIDYAWNGVMIDQVRIYSTGNYHVAMLIFPVAFVVGIIAVLFLRDASSYVR